MVQVKRIFSCLGILCSVFANTIVLANAESGYLENGEVVQVNKRLHTKVTLGGSQYVDGKNNLSIARLYAQRNLLLHPLRNLDWGSEYTKETQNILLSEYLRTVKLTARLNGLDLERQWAEGDYFNYVFSVHESQIHQSRQYTPDRIIASLQRAVVNGDNRLNYAAILEVELRHPGHFDMNSIVSQINSNFGKNLLKFMTGVPIEDAAQWEGDEKRLSGLALNELFLIQSRFPYDQNVAYHLALALEAQNYDMLLQRVVKNSLNAGSDFERPARLVSLAEDLGILYE